MQLGGVQGPLALRKLSCGRLGRHRECHRRRNVVKQHIGHSLHLSHLHRTGVNLVPVGLPPPYFAVDLERQVDDARDGGQQAESQIGGKPAILLPKVIKS